MYTSLTTVIFILSGHILLTDGGSSRFRSFIAEHEDQKPCAYRDDTGNTRVGAGFSLESKDARKFFWTLGEDYDRFYNSRLTSKDDTCVCSRVPCLSKEKLDLLFDMRTEEVLHRVAALIPSFESLCFVVQNVIVDLGYSATEDDFQNIVKLIAEHLKGDNWLAVADNLQRTNWCSHHNRRCSRNTNLIRKGCKLRHLARNRRDVEQYTTVKSTSSSSCCKEKMPVTDAVATESNQDKTTETPLLVTPVKPELSSLDGVRTYATDATVLLTRVVPNAVLKPSAVKTRHDYREMTTRMKPSHEPTRRNFTDAGDYGDILASTEPETPHMNNKQHVNENMGMIQASSSRSVIRHRALSIEKRNRTVSQTVAQDHKSVQYDDSNTLRDTHQSRHVEQTRKKVKPKPSSTFSSSTRSFVYTTVPVNASHRIISEQRTILDTAQPSSVLEDSTESSDVPEINSRTDKSSVVFHDNLRSLSSQRTPSIPEISQTKIVETTLFSSLEAIKRTVTSNTVQVQSYSRRKVLLGKEQAHKNSSDLTLHSLIDSTSSIQRAVDKQETIFRQHPLLRIVSTLPETVVPSHSLIKMVMPKRNSSSSNLMATTRLLLATSAVLIPVLPSEMVKKMSTQLQLASPFPTESLPKKVLPVSSHPSSSFLATSSISIQVVHSEMMRKPVHRFFSHSSYITATTEKEPTQSLMVFPFRTFNSTKRLLSTSPVLKISLLPFGRLSPTIPSFQQVPSPFSHENSLTLKEIRSAKSTLSLSSCNLSSHTLAKVKGTNWKRTIFTSVVSKVTLNMHNSANIVTTEKGKSQLRKAPSAVTTSVLVTAPVTPAAVKSTSLLTVKYSAALPMETHLDQSPRFSASLTNFLPISRAPHLRASPEILTSQKLRISTVMSDPRPNLSLTLSNVGLKSVTVLTTSGLEQPSTSPVLNQQELTSPLFILQPPPPQITSSVLHQPLTSSKLHQSQLKSSQPASSALDEPLLTSYALEKPQVTSFSLIPQLLISTPQQKQKITSSTVHQTQTSFAPHQSQQTISALYQSQPTPSVPYQPQLTSLALDQSQITASALQQSQRASSALHQPQSSLIVPHHLSLTSLAVNQSELMSSALHKPLLTSSTLNPAQTVLQPQIASSELHQSQLTSSGLLQSQSMSFTLHHSQLTSHALNQSRVTSTALHQPLTISSVHQSLLTSSALNDSQPTSLVVHQTQLTPPAPFQPQSAPFTLHQSLLISELHKPALVTSSSLNQRQLNSAPLHKLPSSVLNQSQLPLSAQHQLQLTSSAPHQTHIALSALQQPLLISSELQQTPLASSILHKPQQSSRVVNRPLLTSPTVIPLILPSSLNKSLTTSSLSTTPYSSVWKRSPNTPFEVPVVSNATSSLYTLPSVIATPITNQYFKSLADFSLLLESTSSTTASASGYIASKMATLPTPTLYSLDHFSSSISLLLPTQNLKITASYIMLKSIKSTVVSKRTDGNMGDSSAADVVVNASLQPTLPSKARVTISSPSNIAEENYDETYLVTLRGDCNDVISNSNSFKLTFTEQLSMLLDTNKSDVRCHSVICGSVKVTFTIRNARITNTTSTLMQLMNRNSLEISFKGKVYSALQVTAIHNLPSSTITTTATTPSPTSPIHVPVEALSDLDKKRIKIIAFAAGGAFFFALFIVACVIFCARLCARPGSSAEFHVRNSLRSNEFEMKRFAPAVNGKKYYRKVDYYGDNVEEREEAHSQNSDTDEEEEKEVNNSSTLLRSNYLNPSYRRVNTADTGSQSSVFYY